METCYQLDENTYNNEYFQQTFQSLRESIHNYDWNDLSQNQKEKLLEISQLVEKSQDQDLWTEETRYIRNFFQKKENINRFEHFFNELHLLCRINEKIKNSNNKLALDTIKRLTENIQKNILSTLKN